MLQGSCLLVALPRQDVLHPSIVVLPIKQEPASCPPLGKSIPKAGRRWAVGLQGERSPSRVEISGTTCICATAELPAPTRAALRSWGTGDQHRGGERPHQDLSAGLQTSLEKAAAVYEPALLLMGLEKNTCQGPGCHWDGVLEIPTFVETQFHHRTNITNVGNHRENLTLRDEEEGINELRMSSCIGKDNHNLVTCMWEEFFAPAKKKHTQRWKRGNFQKLKGIISKD